MSIKWNRSPYHGWIYAEFMSFPFSMLNKKLVQSTYHVIPPTGGFRTDKTNLWHKIRTVAAEGHRGCWVEATPETRFSAVPSLFLQWLLLHDRLALEKKDFFFLTMSWRVIVKHHLGMGIEVSVWDWSTLGTQHKEQMQLMEFWDSMSQCPSGTQPWEVLWRGRRSDWAHRILSSVELEKRMVWWWVALPFLEEKVPSPS
jgi:hypothetical protein